MALAFLSLCVGCVEAKLPDIRPQDVNVKVREIMAAHVSHKKMTPELIERTLNNYCEELDPSKTYFTLEDIKQWIRPSAQMRDQILTQFERSDFSAFTEIHQRMVKAIDRRNRLEETIEKAQLPKNVDPKEFKDLDWTKSEAELKDRLLRIRALQVEAAQKLEDDQKELSFARIKKRRLKYEEELSESNPREREKLILSNILKAVASSLDAHTAYFTPGEATQFMIGVQQRLFGIGAQLRDDLNGFTVVKVIDGGPAAKDGGLKAKDRIIAVDGQPVVGMDINDAVELIRGDAGTPVKLRIIRETTGGSGKNDETLDITLIRGEVVLKDTRLESSVEPYSDGAIAYLKLFSFYQDPESSSATDIAQALADLQSRYHIKGVVLDLRYNAGGMLSQAVAVTGLFISRGVVVSIKDENGRVQHLRDLDGQAIWNGPLIVLENRASASAAEIVTQTLQDYGRALIVGDDHTFGKGTFQTFTLNGARQNEVNPQGEYKVTRGTYYTVSGSTPQLRGVNADITVPGILSEMEIGERFAKNPLANDSIAPMFDDRLEDIPERQRQRVAQLYRMNLQPKVNTYRQYLNTLRRNSEIRIEHNKNYQTFLKELKSDDESEKEELDKLAESDFQLVEAYNIMKDLISLMKEPSSLSTRQQALAPTGSD